MLQGFFEDKPVYRKFLIVVSVVLFSTLIFSMVGALLADAIYGVNIISDPTALSDLDNPVVLDALKLLQLLSTGIGMFLLPAVVLAWLFSKHPLDYLNLRKIPSGSQFGVALVVMFAAVPLINLMVSWNEQMQLPPFLSGIEKWMKDSEDNATRITEALLNMNTTGDLIYNLVIVALLPALGEEFLFRGIIQRLFREITSNIHVAIFITAAVFSAIHMQFYGFLPRMMLGVLFGYLLVWTGSLWVPVIAHFINNGAAVIFAYIANKKALPFDQDTIGTSQDDILLVISSIVILGVGLFFIHRNHRLANPEG